MLQISAQHLAALLSGIARAQNAVINGLESAMAGTRTQHILPMLQNAAHLRDHPEPTLTDLPVRVLLTYQGRVAPDIESIARDLERLLSGEASAAPAAGAFVAASALAEPAADAGESLDFSTPAATS